MTWKEIVVPALLAIGIIIELLSCLGLMVARNPLARLHFLGPATILGPVFFGAALVVQEGISQTGLKAILIVITFMITSPLLTHATARALYCHTRGEPDSGDAAGGKQDS